MTRARTAAVIAGFTAVAVATAAPAGRGKPGLYTVAATEACLRSLPNALLGLPPATPPSPPAPFVYRLRPDRFPPAVQAQIGAWYGRPKGAYAGVILSFFKSIAAARTQFKLLYADARSRNVLVGWGRPSASTRQWRTVVRGCLRSALPAGATAPATRPIPRASARTFLGDWGGHTRRLQIRATGRALEITDDGCCTHVYRMTYRILAVRGTLTRATALFRVTSFKRYDRSVPALHPGQTGRLRLRNGILTNTLTRFFFCSDPAWQATGACGA